jgi:hypothetical protein
MPAEPGPSPRQREHTQGLELGRAQHGAQHRGSAQGLSTGRQRCPSTGPQHHLNRHGSRMTTRRSFRDVQALRRYTMQRPDEECNATNLGVQRKVVGMHGQADRCRANELPGELPREPPRSGTIDVHERVGVHKSSATMALGPGFDAEGSARRQSFEGNLFCPLRVVQRSTVSCGAQHYKQQMRGGSPWCSEQQQVWPH